MAHLYERICGTDLDKILEHLGLIQQPNETNWQFRKRAFPILWEHLGNEHDTLAMEFILLLPEEEWSGLDVARYMGLHMSNPSRSDLEKFVEGFSCDPIEFRKACPAKTDWIAKEIIKSEA